MRWASCSAVAGAPARAAVQARPVPDDNVAGADRGTEVGDERAEKLSSLSWSMVMTLSCLSAVMPNRSLRRAAELSPSAWAEAVFGSVNAASNAGYSRSQGLRYKVRPCCRCGCWGLWPRNVTASSFRSPHPAGRLLAFLALRPGPHNRETVAAQLWPETAGSAARANLRTAVWALRKAAGDDALIASRTEIGLRPEAVTVDFADCRRRAAAGDASAAATLCHSELLAGYTGDWAEAARRRQRAELAEVLAARSAAAERDGDAAAAAYCSRLRCELDPLNEAAHADLVRQLAASGDRAGALIAGREVTGRLREELGVWPGPLLRAALAEARGPGTAPFPAGPSAAHPLFGRAAELRTLMAAWTAARAGHGRVVLVTGEAGIGKTRLITELAHRADNTGARTAVGAGVDIGGTAPLAMWQELVPQLARAVPPPPEHADWPAELGRLAPDIARFGRDQPPPVSSPELERLRLFDAVLRLVEWAAAGRPCSWSPRMCTGPTRPACSFARTSAGGLLPGQCCSC